ncbi:MAG: CoB--CoM heterodisulfide reductase iron-sulfur subunit A family protein [Clostridia bacterium]|jgi:heterodisulfide reductase subunit A|nr:CoB--CoM heterodisulfide reductase iron-sulfur subunit A family protein [Clostridia bacterium]
MNEPRIGVYVCHCGSNIGGVVDCKDVAEYAAKLPNVVVSRDYSYMCSDPGQMLIKDDVKNLNLDRIVVASCSPRMHEPTFRTVVEEAGLNPYFMQMANIREHVSWVTNDTKKATEKARDLVRAAARRVIYQEAIIPQEIGITKAALVIGGGVAGIEASLSIAKAGYKTYLVEKSPTIGGVMAQLDKTFPTLDCSACILTPKMVDVAREPNIELITNAEVVGLEGAVGNYTVTVKKTPRYVSADCSGCGDCVSACIMKGRINNEFDYGLAKRGAAYIPFPQAVPLKAVIDQKTCLMLKNGKCTQACVTACERKCIDFTQEAEEVKLEVGAIIVATGFKPFDAKRVSKYGYGLYPDVIDAMQFERLTNASGPTGGKVKTSKGEVPKKVAILHCVGSRDENTNKYCSRVCCMYSLKHAHLAREKTGAEVYNFYMDMRAFGKGYEEFYNRIQGEGVTFIRGKVAEITEKDGQLVLKAEDTLLGKNMELGVDMVVLSVGLEPSTDADKLSEVLHINRTQDGFFMEAHPKLNPLESPTAGIYLAGCAQGPKDIPDTVSQSRGCAGEVIKFLNIGKVKLETTIVITNPDLCKGCRLCEKLCPYGALEFCHDQKIMEVESAKCKGCGTCAAACPAGAIKQQQFSADQVFAEIEALLEEVAAV